MTRTLNKWVLDEDGEPFIYQLNAAGANVFSLNVQGGHIDSGERTSRAQRRAIAEFIFTACNAHEELVKSLQDCVEQLEMIPFYEKTTSDIVAVANAKRILATIEKGA